jgi:hypothetical protein
LCAAQAAAFGLQPNLLDVERGTQMARSWMISSTHTVDLGEEQMLLIGSEGHVGVIYRGAWLREPLSLPRTHEPVIGNVQIRSRRRVSPLLAAKRVLLGLRAAGREVLRIIDATRTELEAGASIRSKPVAE